MKTRRNVERDSDPRRKIRSSASANSGSAGNSSTRNTNGTTHSSAVPVVRSVLPKTGLPTPPIAVHHPHSIPGTYDSPMYVKSTTANTNGARRKWRGRSPLTISAMCSRPRSLNATRAPDARRTPITASTITVTRSIQDTGFRVPRMAWDFSTEPEFEEQLEWMRTFVREEIEPLETIDLDTDTFRPAHRPAEGGGQARGACGPPTCRPSIGGGGFGQVKLGLMHEILGRCSYAPAIFGNKAPDSGNAELIAVGGTERAEGAVDGAAARRRAAAARSR